MRQETGIRRAAVVGLGALGAVYLRQMADYGGDTETDGYVRSPKNYDTEPLTINGEPLNHPLKALTPSAQAADLVIVAVKSYDMEGLLPALEPLIGENTVILSLLNGVTSEEQLAGRFGEEHLLWAVVMGADLNRRGHQVRFNHMGELHFGERDNRVWSQKVRRVKAFLDRCRIPSKVPQDMEREMWKKLMINVGMNQVSTVLEYTYSMMRNSQQAMELMRSAQKEVIAVARSRGIRLSEEDILVWEGQLAGLSDEGRSSMLQDYWEKRKLEIDIFGKFICEAGKAAGLETPVNRCLYEQIQSKVYIQ